MAKHKRLHTLQSLIDIGMVPVFHHADVEMTVNLIQACVEGGAVCVEYTNRQEGAIETFKEAVKKVRVSHPHAILGAGSVYDEGTAAVYINAGADFIVSPGIDEAIASVCHKQKIPYMPGCGTASEVHKAESLGVEICKLFPGNAVGGPGFVKALLGPSPWTYLMPTGGVEPTRESLEAWFKAGIVCTGMGSKLFTKEILANKDFPALTQICRETIAIIKEVKNAS